MWVNGDESDGVLKVTPDGILYLIVFLSIYHKALAAAIAPLRQELRLGHLHRKASAGGPRKLCQHCGQWQNLPPIWPYMSEPTTLLINLTPGSQLLYKELHRQCCRPRLRLVDYCSRQQTL